MDINIDNIKSKADNLLRRLEITQPIVDVHRIAEYLGIDIRFEEIDDDVSGFLLIENDVATMVVNEMQHPNRQRFTIAHEIGHFVLHKGKNDALFVDKKYAVYLRDAKSSGGEDIQEREANRFAADILMPVEMLKKEIEKHRMDLIDDSDAYILAKKFGVSTQALGFRLARLEFQVGRDF